MPARIVIATLGSYGDVNPYVGLALGLQARGHRVVIASSEFFRGYIERQSIAFHPIRPDASPEDQELVRRIMDPARGTQYLLQHLITPALEDTHADLDAAVAAGADLLITHPLTFPGSVIAARRRVRWASSVLAPMSFFSRFDLPVFPPAPGLKRLERLPGAGTLLVKAARMATRSASRPIRRFRARHGLASTQDPVFEGQHSPELVLALFSPVLATPQPDWPQHAHVTGHIPWNGPADDSAMSDALRRFLDDGEAPIVFTLGSSVVASAGDFYRVSARAARRVGRRAVLLVGRHAANRDGVAEGADILVLDYAPHRELFPRASAIVHQGGIGTLQQAMRAGRPMLVVPWAHDQPDNAYRAMRRGVARVVRPHRYVTSRVTAAISALLTREYAHRASMLGELVRAEDGVGTACDRIEELLQRRKP